MQGQETDSCTWQGMLTWGKNIFPAPNRSPTTFMPSMSGLQAGNMEGDFK